MTDLDRLDALAAGDDEFVSIPLGSAAPRQVRSRPMTARDDLAVAALTRALVRTGMYVDAGIDTSAGLDKPQVYAAAILNDPDMAADGLHFVMVETLERQAAQTPAVAEPLTPEWPETRRLVIEGRTVISQTPTDPGDIGEPRLHTEDGTTYVSVPEFELWPTDPDWEPHDASIVYITRRSFTLNAPGRMTYHRPSRHTRYSDRTGCGIEIWSSGWEPGEQSSLIAIRRDVASRIARQCGVCEARRG